jgi:hypothetical protein
MNVLLKIATTKNRLPTIIKNCKNAIDRRMTVFKLDKKLAILKVVNDLWNDFSTDDLLVQVALNPSLENIEPTKVGKTLREHLIFTLDHLVAECINEDITAKEYIKKNISEQNVCMKIPEGTTLNKLTKAEIKKLLELIKNDSFVTRFQNVKELEYFNIKPSSIDNIINEMNLERFRPLIIEKNKIGKEAQMTILKSKSHVKVKSFSLSNVRQVIDAIHDKDTQRHTLQLVS